MHKKAVQSCFTVSASSINNTAVIVKCSHRHSTCSSIYFSSILQALKNMRQKPRVGRMMNHSNSCCVICFQLEKCFLLLLQVRWLLRILDGIKCCPNVAVLGLQEPSQPSTLIREAHGEHLGQGLNEARVSFCEKKSSLEFSYSM